MMRAIRTTFAAAAALGLALAAGAQAQAQEQAEQETGYPTEPPPALEATDVAFPAVAQDTLSNGLRLVVVENREQPVVSVRLYVPAGEVSDPEGKTGVANLTARVLDKGTESRTAAEIASTVEGVGASLDVGASDDYGFVSASSLTKHLPTVMEVFADVVRRPTFPEEEFQNEKRRMLSSLEVQLGQPGVLASRQFRSQVYGAHPYAEEPTPASVEGVTRADLEAFHAERYTPRGALLVVAGDVGAGEARAMAEERFGDWSVDAAHEPAMPDPPARDSTRIYLVHRPGSVQSNIWIGHLGVRPGNEDAHAIDVMNRILGGGANARLFLILREEKGWTYGAYSRFTSPRHQGYFAATAEVRTPVTDSALLEMMRQLDRIREEAVPEEELADAKNYLTGHFPLEIETPSQVASQVSDAMLRGLGLGYLESYRSAISAVDAEQVQAAAREYVRPDRAAIVVVGDATQIYEDLEGIAPITLYDTEGDEISRSDLEVRRTDVSLSADRIRTGSFGYDVVAGGRSLATLGLTIERTDGGNVVLTRELSGAMGDQTTRMEATAGLEPVSVSQEGRMGPVQTRKELTYGDGRVTGTAMVPKQPAGGQGGQRRGGPEMEEVQVDTTFAEGAVDSEMVLPVVLASPIDAELDLRAPLFRAGRSTSQLTATAGDTSTVEVPAGTFRVRSVDLSTGEQRFTLYVTREAPHLLVKQEIVGQPVSFELTSVGEAAEGESVDGEAAEDDAGGDDAGGEGGA